MELQKQDFKQLATSAKIINVELQKIKNIYVNRFKVNPDEKELNLRNELEMCYNVIKEGNDCLKDFAENNLSQIKIEM